VPAAGVAPSMFFVFITATFFARHLIYTGVQYTIPAAQVRWWYARMVLLALRQLGR